MSTDTLGDGSEAELRPEEAVCEVTGLTYYKRLGASPHLEDARAFTPIQLARLHAERVS